MFRALADEEIPWGAVHLFQVDERVAPAGDPDRNLTHLRENLLDGVALPPANPYGTGQRMKLAHTRAMVDAILDGRLAKASTHADPVFGLQIPESCPDVPPEVLNPRSTWADGDAYDAQARKLAGMFAENFKKFEERVSEGVKMAGPKAG